MIKKRKNCKQYEYGSFTINSLEDTTKLGKDGWILLLDKNEKGNHIFVREVPTKKLRL